MTYDVIVADPPWDYYGSGTKMGAAAKEYPLMSDDALLDLSIPLSKPGILFLWATCPRLDFAIRCIEEWNLLYRGVAFVWVKTTKAGVPIGAQGVRPSITKPLTELCLAASNVMGRPLPLASESITQTVFAPKQEHSRKPDAVQNAIEVMYPNATKLEMFARRERPGWDVWGNEV